MSGLPGPLVSVDWLVERLDDSDLRVFDCSIDVVRTDGGADASFDATEAMDRWREAHVPGAPFADLVALSDNSDG